MTFKYENLTYKFIYKHHIPVAVEAVYLDGDLSRKIIVPYESKYLQDAIHLLKEELGYPLADPFVDDF
jgi:hypothetical protein